MTAHQPDPFRDQGQTDDSTPTGPTAAAPTPMGTVHELARSTTGGVGVNLNKDKTKPHRILTVQELERQAADLGMCPFGVLSAWFASRQLGLGTSSSPGREPLTRV